MSSVDIRHLYELHGAELRQVMSRLAPEVGADDLLHELFVHVLHEPTALSTAQSPRAWLFGVAIKLAATRRRSARLRSWLGIDRIAAVPSTDRSDRLAEQQDAERAVAEALESVALVRRQAFVLFELQGLSGEEVAEALGIPLKTVWTRLFHARREVTDAIERQRLREARTSGLRREEIGP